MDTKLNMIFDEIMNLKVDQAGTRKLVSSTNEFLKHVYGKINEISSVVNKLSY